MPALRLLPFLFVLISIRLFGQEGSEPIKKFEDAAKAEVMVLGTFHFDDAGLDSYKPAHAVDVRTPERQKELEEVIHQLAQFKPDRIAVEVTHEYQQKLDSLYQLYLADQLVLKPSELYQIGFRLARHLGHERVWAVDAPARRYTAMTQEEWDQEVAKRPAEDDGWGWAYYALYQQEDSMKVTRTLKDHLIQVNSNERIERALGHYLTGDFKLSNGPTDFFGVDHMTFWWNRNLRIFRNIQRITTEKDQRILVVIGSGHVPILKQVISASPEYEFVEVGRYLK